MSILFITALSSCTVDAASQVVKIKESPKAVVSKVNQALLRALRTPYWYVPSNIMMMWAKVNICEMGGRWDIGGPVYSGGLGITNINWVAFGGHEFAPRAELATPMQQVAVARRIQGNDYVPDQNGCGPGW